MFDQLPVSDIQVVLVERLLREYYNDIGNVLEKMFGDQLDIEDLENILIKLDRKYAHKIIKEFR